MSDHPKVTEAQSDALAELRLGECWPTSGSTGGGWVNARAAASLVEMGMAKRMYVGEVGAINERGNVGGGCYLYWLAPQERTG